MLRYVSVDETLNIPRYRPQLKLDSLGCTNYTSLDMSTGAESKFGVLEKSHTSHSGYEAQTLSDSILHQVSHTNTLSRRKHIGENDIVHTNLHLAREADVIPYLTLP